MNENLNKNVKVEVRTIDQNAWEGVRLIVILPLTVSLFHTVIVSYECEFYDLYDVLFTCVDFTAVHKKFIQ